MDKELKKYLLEYSLRLKLIKEGLVDYYDKLNSSSVQYKRKKYVIREIKK